MYDIYTNQMAITKQKSRAETCNIKKEEIEKNDTKVVKITVLSRYL